MTARARTEVDVDLRGVDAGGSALRTAIALAFLRRRPATIRRIRPGRRQPGLQRIHRELLNAISPQMEVTVSGDDVRLVPRPAEQVATIELDYAFCDAPAEPEVRVSTDWQRADSTFVTDVHGLSVNHSCVTPLVALAALVVTGRTATVVVRGGTEVPGAPSPEELAGSFLPLLAARGRPLKLGVRARAFMGVGEGAVLMTAGSGSALREGSHRVYWSGSWPPALDSRIRELNDRIAELAGTSVETELIRLPGTRRRVSQTVLLDGPYGTQRCAKVCDEERDGGDVLQAERLLDRVRFERAGRARLSRFAADQALPYLLGRPARLNVDASTVHLDVTHAVIDAFAPGEVVVHRGSSHCEIEVRA